MSAVFVDISSILNTTTSALAVGGASTRRITSFKQGDKAMRFKHYIGFTLVAVAISLSGMENPLIPIAVMTAGMWLIKELVTW